MIGFKLPTFFIALVLLFVGRDCIAQQNDSLIIKTDSLQIRTDSLQIKDLIKPVSQQKTLTHSI